MIDNLVAYEFFKDADYYGICETAANTAAKVVTIPDFTLENGVSVMVKFKNNNTTNSPTLNVSDTGAKPIYIDPSVGTSVSWEAWKVLPFVYDGTNWQLVCDPGIAVTQIPTDDTNNNYEVLFSKSPDNLEHMEEVRKSQYLNYNPNQRTLFVNDGNETAPTETTTDLLVGDENWVWVKQEGSAAWSDNYIVFGVSSQYDGSNSLEKVIYTGGIPKTVKKIRYTIYEQYKKYGTDVDHQLCVGIKTVRNYYAMPSDTDFVIKNLHDFTASGDNIIGELNVDLDTDPNIQYYLYIIANSWGATVTQLDLVEYSNPIYNRGYISNNSLGVIKTSNNVVTSLKVKDDDIVLSGTDNTWDGIHTSLKDIVKIGICLSQSLSGSTDISDTTPINLGGTMIQGNGRPILIQIYGVIKTDRNTSSLVMYIDGVEEVRAVTNSTTPMKVDGSAVVYLDAGIHTVSFKLVPQDNTTTATLCAYNTYGYTMIGA